MILGVMHKNGFRVGGPWFLISVATVSLILGFDAIPYLLLHNGILTPFFLIIILYLTHSSSKLLSFVFSNKVSVYLGEN